MKVWDSDYAISEREDLAENAIKTRETKTRKEGDRPIGRELESTRVKGWVGRVQRRSRESTRHSNIIQKMKKKNGRDEDRKPAATVLVNRAVGWGYWERLHVVTPGNYVAQHSQLP
jgi:endo-1,4-beta-D-glucanase Y